MLHAARRLVVPSLSLVAVIAGCSTAPSDRGVSDAAAPHGSAPTGDAASSTLPPPVFLSDHRFDARGESTSGSAMLVGLFGESTSGGELAGPAEAEANLKQISFATEGGDFTPDIDPHGRFLIYASKQHSENFDLYRKSVDGRTVTQLSSDPADDMMPALSPDGSKVAFVSNRSGNWDVFVMPFEGGPATQLSFESDDEVQPTWSPDGRKLAFARKNGRTGRWEIWSADATQPSGATYLCDGFLPRWCPDAKQSKLLFQRARQQGSRLYGVWTVDLVGGEAMHPTEIVSAQNAAIIQPNWSPDGSRIVFTTVVDPTAQGTDLPEQSDLWIVNLDGTGRTSLTSGKFRNMQPVWGPDDRVYFVSNRGGIENVWTVSAAAGGPAGEMAAPHGAVAGAQEMAAEEVADGAAAGHAAAEVGESESPPAAAPETPHHN